MALIPLRAQVREEKTVVGWLLHKVLLLVPRSPTPRTNCSSRPPMAPEGLEATAPRSPTVLLYAARKAERTSCRRVSRSLRAASLWRRKNKCITMGQDQLPHPHVTIVILPSSPAQGPKYLSCSPLKPFLSVFRLLFVGGTGLTFYGKQPSL